MAGQARTLKAALEHRIGAKVSLGARILCWLGEFVACVMNRCDTGIGEKIFHIPPSQQKEESGTAVPSWNVCWHAELVIGSGGCHRARAGDQETRSERQEKFLSRRDGTRTEYSEHELFRGLRMAVMMHSTFKSEWRDPPRWCPVLGAKF